MERSRTTGRTEPGEKRTPVRMAVQNRKNPHDAAIDGSQEENNPLQHHGSQESLPRDDVEGKNTRGPKFLGHVERGRTLTLGWESVLLTKGCTDGRKGTRIGPLQRGGCPAKQAHAELLRTGSLRANREDVVPNVFEPGPTAQDCVQSLTNSVPYIALGRTHVARRK